MGNRRKNLSEELIINNDLEIKSQEEVADDLEKEKEKLEKEVNKEIEAKVKDVEEINDAEAPKLDLKDGEGKKVKIKELTEKLILEEPTDTLNEDFDDEDRFDQAVFELAENIANLLRGFKSAWVNYGIENGMEKLDFAMEDAFDIARNNMLAADESLQEEVLDEKIPSDLSRAYKRHNYKGLPNSDLENATYDVVSPEDGYAAYKRDPLSVRLLIGNQLVDFYSDGKASLDHRTEWLPSDKQYTNRNGKVVRDTKYIPPKELFKLADKVYVTNENTPEGKKDQELLKQRSFNPESPNANWDSRASHMLNNRGIGTRGWGDYIRGSTDRSDIDYNRRNYKSYIQRYKDNLANADRYKDDEANKENRDYYLDRAKNSLKNAQDYRASMQDSAARIRYANSEASLQKNLNKYNNLKSNLGELEHRLEKSTRDLSDARQFGSPLSRDNKEKLKDLNDKLKDIKRRIALVELDLEETDEEDAKAVAQAEEKYNNAMAAFDNAKAEINALLRRS